jgi:Skp family chaperone for outer membrane proteins
MIRFNNLMLAAALAAPAIVAVAPAHAQISGIGVVDPDAAVNNCRAWKAASQLLTTTYKPQLDQAEARERAVAAELQPLITAYETARRAANPNQAALRTQAESIQQKQAAWQQELTTLTTPFARARAYALEQLQGQLRPAIDAAAKRKNASLVLLPNTVAFMQPAADLTADVTTELDRLIPTVSITPPANWQPGGQGQQQGAPQAAAPAPAAPARNQPTGR